MRRSRTNGTGPDAFTRDSDAVRDRTCTARAVVRSGHRTIARVVKKIEKIFFSIFFLSLFFPLGPLPPLDSFPRTKIIFFSVEKKIEKILFRFLRTVCYANIKGSVGLILAKTSAMRISIPLDLSSRSFIPLPRFMRPRRAAPLIAPSLVFYPRRFA
jgi:hypothetical protein